MTESAPKLSKSKVSSRLFIMISKVFEKSKAPEILSGSVQYSEFLRWFYFHTLFPQHHKHITKKFQKKINNVEKIVKIPQSIAFLGVLIWFQTILNVIFFPFFSEIIKSPEEELQERERKKHFLTTHLYTPWKIN